MRLNHIRLPAIPLFGRACAGAWELAAQRGRVVALDIRAEDLTPITFREWTIACRDRLR